MPESEFERKVTAYVVKGFDVIAPEVTVARAFRLSDNLRFSIELFALRDPGLRANGEKSRPSWEYWTKRWN